MPEPRVNKRNVKVEPSCFYSQWQLCRLLQVAWPTVDRWVKRGLLPAIVMPGTGRLRFRHDDVIAFSHDHGMPLVGLAGDAAPVLLEPAAVSADACGFSAAVPAPSRPSRRTVPNRKVYGVNEISRLLGCATKTVQDLIDAGHLLGFRAAGRGYRKVPRECLIAFMQARGLPPDLLSQPRKETADEARP